MLEKNKMNINIKITTSDGEKNAKYKNNNKEISIDKTSLILKIISRRFSHFSIKLLFNRILSFNKFIFFNIFFKPHF